MKDYSVNLTVTAERDISNAVDYIDNVLHNPQAADNLLDGIESAIYSLPVFPEKFPLVQDPVLASRGIRIMSVSNYLILYTIDKSAAVIHVVRFLYGKSNWQNILKSDI